MVGQLVLGSRTSGALQRLPVGLLREWGGGTPREEPPRCQEAQHQAPQPVGSAE